MPKNKIKNLFTFGCSFTRDNYQDTWADLLAKHYDLKLTNEAERGCGSSYITKRLLINKDIDPSDSLVAIMWPCADRFDLWADSTTPHLTNEYDLASWPDGKGPRLVDLHGNRRLDQGFILNGSIPRGYKHHYFKYFYSAYQTVHDWYVNIITAQFYLDRIGVPYLMMPAFPVKNPLQYHIDHYAVEDGIFDLINFDRFVEDSMNTGFYYWCKTKKFQWLDPNHPKTEAHQSYLNEFVIPKIDSSIL